MYPVVQGGAGGICTLWLGVARASDPLLLCGIMLCCCRKFLLTLLRNGIVSYAAPNRSPEVFWPVRRRVRFMLVGEKEWTYRCLAPGVDRDFAVYSLEKDGGVARQVEGSGFCQILVNYRVVTTWL